MAKPQPLVSPGFAAPINSVTGKACASPACESLNHCFVAVQFPPPLPHPGKSINRDVPDASRLDVKVAYTSVRFVPSVADVPKPQPCSKERGKGPIVTLRPENVFVPEHPLKS